MLLTQTFSHKTKQIFPWASGLGSCHCLGSVTGREAVPRACDGLRSMDALWSMQPIKCWFLVKWGVAEEKHEKEGAVRNRKEDCEYGEPEFITKFDKHWNATQTCLVMNPCHEYHTGGKAVGVVYCSNMSVVWVGALVIESEMVWRGSLPCQLANCAPTNINWETTNRIVNWWDGCTKNLRTVWAQCPHPTYAFVWAN